MRNQLLFLMYFLATNEGFAGGSGGSGPPMRSIGALENGISTIAPAGHSVNCRLNEAQLVVEAKGTHQRLLLNPMVIARTTGGSGSGPPGKVSEVSGGSSGSGIIGNTIEVAAIISHHSLSKLKFFIENNEDLVIRGENGWIEVESINHFANPDLVEIVLESTTIKLTASESGIAGGGPPGERLQANNSFEGGAGGSTPTIADIDNGAAGGGGTIGDGGAIIGSGGGHPFKFEGGIHSGGGAGAGLQMGCTADDGATGAGGTIGYKGISGGSGVVTKVDGGSGVGSGGWKKESDGITVGGGTPY